MFDIWLMIQLAYENQLTIAVGQQLNGQVEDGSLKKTPRDVRGKLNVAGIEFICRLNYIGLLGVSIGGWLPWTPPQWVYHVTIVAVYVT